MRIYSELSEWWPLFSPPSHYGEEAADLLATIGTHQTFPPRTLLELGSGGGSLAFHLKPHYELTLTDISPGMLENNRAINPEAELHVGDMRSLRLGGRTFDIVLVHDAIMYAATPADVMATIRTAALHCKPGGLVVLLPDHVAETFEGGTECGGEDAPDGRGFRYLSWAWDPDPEDSTFEVHYSFVMREADGTVTVESERHVEGLFPRENWLGWMRAEALDPRVHHDAWNRDVFVGVKGASA